MQPGKKDDKPKKEGEGKGKENKPAAKPAPKDAAAKKPAAPKKVAVAKKPAAPKKDTGAKKAAAKKTTAGKKDNKLGVKKDQQKKTGKKVAVKGGKTTKDTKKRLPKVHKSLNRFAPIFEKKRKLRKRAPIGTDQPKRRDLSRYIKWPRYIRVQKQRKVLMMRLKVPPTVFQFTRTLDRANGTYSFSLHSQSFIFCNSI